MMTYFFPQLIRKSQMFKYGPAPIILLQNIVGFSQLDKMKDLRKCFTPETSAAVQLGADQNSARKYNCSLRR